MTPSENVPSRSLFIASLRSRWALRGRPSEGGAFYVVLCGGCSVELERGAPLALGRGDVLFVPTGKRHVLYDEADVVAQELAFGATFGSAAASFEMGTGAIATRLLAGSLAAFGGGASAPLAIFSPRPTLATWLDFNLSYLADEPFDDPTLVEQFVTPLVELFLARVLAAAPRPKLRGPRSAHDQHVSRALGLIQREPHKPWTASTLARCVGLSRTQLFERFSRAVGEPPWQYLRRWRMQVSAELLKDSRTSVDQVAERVGYRSAESFCRAFRRATGVSPADFRRGSIYAADFERASFPTVA